VDEYSLQIRNVHIASGFASAGLFFLRGFALNVLGVRWVMAAPLRSALDLPPVDKEPPA